MYVRYDSIQNYYFIIRNSEYSLMYYKHPLYYVHSLEHFLFSQVQPIYVKFVFKQRKTVNMGNC